METLVYAAITIALLVLWLWLEKTKVTPYDIYRDFKASISYVAPEDIAVMLGKARSAIRKVEAIYDQGPNTEAGAEAVEILRKLRKFETDLRLR